MKNSIQETLVRTIVITLSVLCLCYASISSRGPLIYSPRALTVSANIPVGGILPFVSANIPVGGIIPFVSANIPVGGIIPFVSANIPVGGISLASLAESLLGGTFSGVTRFVTQ